MIAMLLYSEDPKESDQILRVDDFVISRMVDMYGYELFIIDKTRTGSRIFPSLVEAIKDKRFLNHTWIYFDRKATEYLDNHPTDNVVYVIGSDKEGDSYEGIERNGKSYRLRVKDPNKIYYAITVLPYVMAHRWIS